MAFEFAEPFGDDNHDNWKAIGTLYADGLVSLETAVRMLSLTDAPDEEIERIRAAGESKRNAGNTEPTPEPPGGGGV